MERDGLRLVNENIKNKEFEILQLKEEFGKLAERTNDIETEIDSEIIANENLKNERMRSVEREKKLKENKEYQELIEKMKQIRKKMTELEIEKRYLERQIRIEAILKGVRL